MPGMKPVCLKLKITNVRASVTVTGNDGPLLSTDGESNRDAVELDRAMLDRLPVMDQDLVRAASEFLDPGAVGGGVSLVVDGVETSDIGVTPSAIEEVRVNRNPYSAEYSRPGRGRIEIITKQGSPKYHGTFNFRVRDYRLDARNAFAAERPKQQRRGYEGHLTGPIGASAKNTFLFSAERDEDDEQDIVLASTLEGVVTFAVPNPKHETELSMRLNRYQSDKQNFSVRYAYDTESQQGGGAHDFVLPEATYDSNESSHRIYVNHRWFPSPRWLSELNLRVRRRQNATISLNPNERQIVVLDAFTRGGAQRNKTEQGTDLELSYVVSYSAGRHYLRMGALVPELEFNHLNDLDNFGGTYYFRSLADYQAGQPYSFTQRQGDTRLRYSSRRLAGFFQDDIHLRDRISLGLGLRYDWENYVPDHVNFAPRASLAIGLGEQAKTSTKTVLRTGAGIFHERRNGDVIVDKLLLDGQRVRDLQISDPHWPEPDLGSANSAAPAVFRTSRRLKTPYLFQANIALEQELSRALSLSVGYTWLRGVDLFRPIDANAPAPPGWQRPDPRFQTITELQSSADLKSHQLNASLRGHMTKWFNGAVLYTFGRAYNNSDGWDSLPPNTYDLSHEWGPASFDRRHNFRLLGSVALPAGFNLGASFRISSGEPYNWTTGFDGNNDGTANDRPSGVSRNALRETGRSELSVRLSRDFVLRPKAENSPRLQFSLDGFNILNQVYYTRFVGNQSSPFFLKPVAAGDARQMQASLRFEF